MARRGRIEIEVGLKSEAFYRDLNRFTHNVRRMLAGLGVYFGGRELTRLVQTGIKFNATMEDAKLGIATVLKLTDERRFGDFNKALGQATTMLDQLWEASQKSASTFSDLMQLQVSLAGDFARANIPLSEQVSLLVSLADATRLLASTGGGFSQMQAVSEIRALLQGRFDPRASVLATLFGDRRAEFEAAVKSGKAFDMLRERLVAMTDAANKARSAWSVLFSNLKQAWEKGLGLATQQSFVELKSVLGDILNTISSPEFHKGLAALGAAAAKIAQAGARGVSLIGVRPWSDPQARVRMALRAFERYMPSADPRRWSHHLWGGPLGGMMQGLGERYWSLRYPARSAFGGRPQPEGQASPGGQIAGWLASSAALSVMAVAIERLLAVQRVKQLSYLFAQRESLLRDSTRFGMFTRASQFVQSQRQDQLLTRMVAALETLAATVAGTRLRVDA